MNSRAPARIEWTPDLETGNPMIDADHRVLVNMLNQLIDAQAAGRADEVIASILAGLLRYTQTHFAREEAEMKRRAYPEMVAHVHAHAGFVRKVAEFEQKYEAGQMTLSAEVIQFMCNWLVNHIMSVDKRLGTFLK